MSHCRCDLRVGQGGSKRSEGGQGGTDNPHSHPNVSMMGKEGGPAQPCATATLWARRPAHHNIEQRGNMLRGTSHYHCTSEGGRLKSIVPTQPRAMINGGSPHSGRAWAHVYGQADPLMHASDLTLAGAGEGSEATERVAANSRDLVRGLNKAPHLGSPTRRHALE